MLTGYLLLSAALFTLGLIGFCTRRNLIIVFLCTELMFQAIVLNLVGFSRFPLSGNAPNLGGQAFGLFLLTVAAAEAALALALVVLLFRCRGSLDAGVWTHLREE
ncbi:MAG: NADH-quinone oxidoreductase subunit NuoK [Phycisphaerae bacterium]|jgi:NADH-quinone oxidoreductase subunit K|nr:NADH-quinone oxidoreductase subunit NuoK [Phycisphaerae bacterium]MCZ2398448.1 NADH-quinone oxidoreductase subunit NuoK [Phycisphaerae bacterium]NUQ50739.1 NADH-quinone oxidoreductase subunit NuoK [Phycisphaerae bacterium]